MRLFAQATDPESRVVIGALARIAGRMAQLDGAGAFDIRGAVADAAGMAITAKRRGKKLADIVLQGDLDKAVKALTQARDGLERKQPGGGEEPGGGEDPEQPGSGGQTERPGGVKPGAGGNADTSKPGTAGTETLSKTGAQTLLLAVTACIMLAAGFSITTARSRRR